MVRIYKGVMKKIMKKIIVYVLSTLFIILGECEKSVFKRLTMYERRQ